MKNSLSKGTALVTGASSGNRAERIGMLKKCFQQGWSVVVTSAKFVGKCLKAVACAIGVP